MSIHSRPEEHGDRDPIAPVSPESGATMDPPSPRKPISGYAHLRKSNAPNEIALPARKWLSRLPHQVRPINLIGQYPRIVNRVRGRRGTIRPHSGSWRPIFFMTFAAAGPAFRPKSFASYAYCASTTTCNRRRRRNTPGNLRSARYSD